MTLITIYYQKRLVVVGVLLFILNNKGSIKHLHDKLDELLVGERRASTASQIVVQVAFGHELGHE